MNKTGLSVSAHSAGFVWRAGGAIAPHAARGIDMHAQCPCWKALRCVAGVAKSKGD